MSKKHQTTPVGIYASMVRAIRDNPGITSLQASQIAGAGRSKHSTTLKKMGYIKKVGTVLGACCNGRSSIMSIFEVTEQGIEYCKGKYFAPRIQPAYTPAAIEPGRALGVQFAPMHQPAYVPPVWESVR